MKTKEISVHVKVPYQKAPYQVGHVEFGLVAILEDGEDPGKMAVSLFENVNSTTHQMAHDAEVYRLSLDQGETVDCGEEYSQVPSRRRKPDNFLGKDDI